MKKLLGILFLSLLFGGSAYATCYSDIEWNITDNREWKIYDYEFSNTTSREIVISQIELLTKNRESIKIKKLNPPILLKSYGRQVGGISYGDVNRKFVKWHQYTCNYK
jgi:hypothetical protein